MQVQERRAVLERAIALEADYLELLVEFAVLVGLGLARSSTPGAPS